MSTNSPDAWNPRYVAYAANQGRDPETMLQHDKKRFPGGCMGEFIVWIGQRWREWDAISGAIRHSYTKTDHANFDAWLSAKCLRGQQLELELTC